MFQINNGSSKADRQKIGIEQTQDLDNLITQVAKGDREAFAAVYEQTKASVYAFALSVVKNSTTAEDVMQDTYVSIAKNAGSYVSQGKPMAWILTITRNAALMKLQKSENKNSSLDEFVDTAEERDDYSKSDYRIMLKTAMTVLSDEEKQIVVLHAVSGMKHREIGEMLNLPLPTVLTKYNRALAKMKKVLGGDGDE